MKNNSRAIAALILCETLKGKFPFRPNQSKWYIKLTSEQDKSFVTNLCFSVLRWHIRLSLIAHQLIAKPLRTQDMDVFALLLIGLYQLQEPTNEFAPVHECVEGAKFLKKPWATGLINACLRRYLREKETLANNLSQNLEFKFSHPSWLSKKIRTSWPEQWESILSANLEMPPLFLRVNQQKIKMRDYLALLKTQQIEVNPFFHPEEIEIDNCIWLKKPLPVENLPGFTIGMVSVQNRSAQLAAHLLGLRPKMRVLDACSAPGGKAAHILEQQPTCELVCIDNQPERVAKMQQTFDRLHLKPFVITGDCGNTKQWWDGQPFDRILLDAPCSGTGVIRSHPDIKHLLTPQKIQELCIEQKRLLHALWPLLKKGGLLLYATCSILSEENAKQIQQFLSDTVDASLVTLLSPFGNMQEVGLQILTDQNSGLDGFYYAALSKKS